MKFKNVLRGYIGRERLVDFLVIIDTEKTEALYCGGLEAYLDYDIALREYRKKIGERTVKNSQMIGAHKLIIFVE